MENILLNSEGLKYWPSDVLVSLYTVLWYRESIVVDFEFSFKISIVGSPEL